MPIFDYQCQACGHHFDVLQKAGEGVLRKCPECGKLKLRKALSAPSFHLKGSGWYKTDFRDKNAAKAAAKSGSKSDDGSAAKAGHSMDSAKEHSHDHGSGGHSHSHDSGGHTHSHGGKTHTHGPGCGHKH